MEQEKMQERTTDLSTVHNLENISQSKPGYGLGLRHLSGQRPQILFSCFRKTLSGFEKLSSKPFQLFP